MVASLAALSNQGHLVVLFLDSDKMDFNALLDYSNLYYLFSTIAIRDDSFANDVLYP